MYRVKMSTFQDDLKKLIKNKKFTSHLNFLGPGLTSAAETIEKTKNRILKEAESDPSLHLLLYKNFGTQKILPWWSEVLHRIAISQIIIEKNVKEKNLTFENVQDLFPNEKDKTLKHILTAIQYNVVNEEENKQEEKRKIIQELLADPETYERFDQWNMEKREYVYKCIAGFINGNLQVGNRMKPDIVILVAKKEEQFGYYKSGLLIGLDDYDTLMTPRDSMIWFAQEVANVLMFDFEWEQAMKWASYVYKTLTYT
jgi:hypothetical protein